MNVWDTAWWHLLGAGLFIGVLVMTHFSFYDVRVVNVVKAEQELQQID